MTLQTLLERTNCVVLFWSTAASLVAVGLAWWLARRPSKVPDRRQAAGEMLVGQIYSICRDAFGPRCTATCVSLFGTLVVLAVVSNVLSLVPIRGLSLGLIPEGGLEIGGEEYRDFNNDGAWRPGEPSVRDDLPDWRSPGRKAGFLLPTMIDPTTGANILLELSFVYTAAAAALLLLPTFARATRERSSRTRWYAWPVAAAAALVESIRTTAALMWRPLGGALVAIAVGVIAYNFLLAYGVTFLVEAGIGLFETLIVAVVLARRHGARAAVASAGAGAR